VNSLMTVSSVQYLPFVIWQLTSTLKVIYVVQRHYFIWQLASLLPSDHFAWQAAQHLVLQSAVSQGPCYFYVLQSVLVFHSPYLTKELHIFSSGSHKRITSKCRTLSDQTGVPSNSWQIQNDVITDNAKCEAQYHHGLTGLWVACVRIQLTSAGAFIDICLCRGWVSHITNTLPCRTTK
jgi:hypothetical protein